MTAHERLGGENVSREDVSIAGEYGSSMSPGTREARASILGRKVRKILEQLAVSSEAADDAGLVAVEAITNGFKYDNGVTEVKIARIEKLGKAWLEITVISATTLAEGTPTKDNMGVHLRQVGNQNADHGRGALIIDEYTKGNWGQFNEKRPDGSRVLRTEMVIGDRPRGPVSGEKPPDPSRGAA